MRQRDDAVLMRQPEEMGAISVSILIAAEPDEVWSEIEAVETHVDWMVDAVAIRFEGTQRRGVGTRFVCHTRLGPLRLRDHMEITDWEPPRAMGVRHAGVVRGTGRFTLSPAAGGGTTFAWDEDLRFPWWLAGRLGEAIGGPLVLRPLWRRNLKTLKGIVEFTPPPSPPLPDIVDTR